MTSAATWGCMALAMILLGGLGIYLHDLWAGYDPAPKRVSAATLVAGVAIVLLLLIQWWRDWRVQLPKLHPLVAIAVFAVLTYLVLF